MQKKIDVSIAPRVYTKYIQTPDMSWNKNFKALATEKYDQWWAGEGINQLTSAGNLKPPPHRTIVSWILEAWEEISPEAIKRKVSLAKPEKTFKKPTVNSDQKKVTSMKLTKWCCGSCTRVCYCWFGSWWGWRYWRYVIDISRVYLFGIDY